MKELPKAYEAKNYEDTIYKRWEESGFFNPDNLSAEEPYSVMMPPPNVTGVLHLGHALEHALMDTMIRYQRMQGKKALLVPGTDHAAVATQAKVESILVKEGMQNPRQELGREELLKRIREFAENSKATILAQIRKMGTSCDWSRLAYTFDVKRSKAVNELFTRMYNDGLIYRGYRVVNWSVKGQSTCSDDELVYIERPAKLYYFKYSKDFPITIATTRPETKLGDSAVAVNPKDKRYKKYIGQTFAVDVGSLKPLQIKIIADENIEMEFGTGALGVTPAHSPIDFAMYEKQKAQNDPIELIQVIGTDGKMTKEAGKDYEGLSVEEAREKFVNYLKEQNLLEKEEDITQNVGTSDRFKDIVEALPSTQWFVDVNKEIPGREKSLKDLMKEAVTRGHNGDSAQKVKVTPDRFKKIYLHWIDNLRDWCISRQIWWGHRIPVWYKGEERFVGTEPPTGEGWEQDPDTLDTWFSSGSWTFSTLGWPEQTEDLKTFHPSHWMQMGHEILFFWMARMIMMSTYALDQIPFKDVYIHGMVRDEKGQKFSKSADNGIDPLEMIEKYGADALRWTVLNGIAPGNDTRFYTEKIEGARNLVNKLWNIARFILLNIENPQQDIGLPELKTHADRWIIGKLNEVTKEISTHIEQFNFSHAGERLRDFTWNELADWYLEIAKIEKDKSAILNFILNTILKLWHPYVPFVTETIWNEIYGTDKLLMVEQWPSIIKEQKEQNNFELIKNIITSVRSLRADYKIEPAKKLSVIINAGDSVVVLKDNEEVLKGLGRVGEIKIENKSGKPTGSVGFVERGVEVFIDLADVVDIKKEKVRIAKELEEAEKYLVTLEKKLKNKEFVKNAPEAVVNAEKEKLKLQQEKVEKLKSQLASL